MAFVPVPKDLNKIKTKVMFNLTSRQLVCFGLALVIAIPSFIFLQSRIGNEFGLLIVGLIISPLIFFAVFEKDGLTGEIYLQKMVEVKFKKPTKRIYSNNNYYKLANDTTRAYLNYKPKTKKKRGKRF